MYPYTYRRPDSLEEAVGILRDDEDAKLLAGGQSLLPTMKHRLAAPTTLVDLQGIDGLRDIRIEDDQVIVGALARHADVAASADIQRNIPALAVLARGIGDPLVRNMGTIAGSIANNDPAADYPAAILGLNATVKTDNREIAADDFFTDMFLTGLEPDEIIVSVAFPIPRRAGYFKLPHPASGFVLAGAFVAQFDDHIRVAINGATNCVFRSRDLEAALARGFDSSNVQMPEIDPGNICSDIHADRTYRLRVLPGVLRRALEQATASTPIFENGEK